MRGSLWPVLFVLLLMGVVALIASLANRTAAASARKRVEVRVSEPARGREYTVWLARQQGYDLSHRAGGRAALYFVFRPAPGYWPPKLGGPVGGVALPAGYPPPSPEELRGIRREIRRTENISTGFFLANFGLSAGVVYGVEALRRWHAGTEAKVALIIAAVCVVMALLATLKLLKDRRQRRRKFDFSMPGTPPWLPPAAELGSMPPSGTWNEGPRQ
ncbi:hypothetical protein ABT168_01340 [Streptomyces sp. NPDC001793]|uniref:hypothetical protein n=1 Tax=Streptomyces sp. NPDC001793 TaxID=3154657 RepID=UPI00332DAF2C